ncbi:MAG: hypothetical protein LBR88_08690 [Zoogloeaceae bacterium]|nr:hypothetical protein [Zoogloeaceae bacterium]
MQIECWNINVYPLPCRSQQVRHVFAKQFPGVFAFAPDFVFSRGQIRYGARAIKLGHQSRRLLCIGGKVLRQLAEDARGIPERRSAPDQGVETGFPIGQAGIFHMADLLVERISLILGKILFQHGYRLDYQTGRHATRPKVLFNPPGEFAHLGFVSVSFDWVIHCRHGYGSRQDKGMSRLSLQKRNSRVEIFSHDNRANTPLTLSSSSSSRLFMTSSRLV